MRKLIWIFGLWLVGICQAHAFDLGVPESLNYNVYWGFVNMGSARIDYSPRPDGYVLRAVVKDDSALIDMNDSWQSEGRHGTGKPFQPTVYSTQQAENKYRSDKTMTFDAKARQVVYVNKIDASDVAEPLPLTDARDVLATVYAWRMGGLQEVTHAAEVPMVSLKRVITLQRSAGVKTLLKIGSQSFTVWKVLLTTVKGDKPSKDTWTVYLTDDANLTPVQIIAATKFGTFRAVLQK